MGPGGRRVGGSGDDLEDAVHEAPVAGEGAEVGVVAGGGGGGEFDDVRLADADQLGAVGEDFWALWGVVLGHGLGVGEHLIGEGAQVGEFAGFDEDKVVLEGALFVDEEEHDLGTGLHFEGGFVEFHDCGEDAELEFGHGGGGSSGGSGGSGWGSRSGLFSEAGSDGGEGEQGDEE